MSGSPTKKTLQDLTPQQRLANVKMKQALHALAKVPPEKRLEILKKEAARRKNSA